MRNKTPTNKRSERPMQRRDVLKLAAATMAAMATPSALAGQSISQQASTRAKLRIPQKAFVYTELQISAPFGDIPWQALNRKIKQQAGFINKTWLYGVGNGSSGGLYAFDSIENAQKFVTGYFPAEAASFGVAQTTRVFDAQATALASRDMNSLHYDGKLERKPGAFVYTEIQLNALPFDSAAPWRKLNPLLKQQPGLLAKTWLSGVHTGTPGGFYAFDTVANAKKFALEYFPLEAKSMNAAFYTRVFDSAVTEAASRDMYSPFYS